MVDRVEHHIILLPYEDYWAWVDAVREYAVHFRASVTPRPQNAANFHYPDQVITVIDSPGMHASLGYIVDWLEHEAPGVPLDVIAADTPDEARGILNQRVARDVRFEIEGLAEAEEGGEPFRLAWPTDYPVIVQPFGANPAIYRRWGLPGHEGIDIRAPLNSLVYAAADGEVYHVDDGRGGHAYGIHVRIRHPGGYKTIYAHLNRALVSRGYLVSAGDAIGLADSTGNSTGSHLHLALKKDGATSRGETDYPWDFVDPTPYLVDAPGPIRGSTPDWWPYNATLSGIHARIGGGMEEADWSLMRDLGIGAIKFRSDADSGDVVRAKAITPDIFTLVQLWVEPEGKTITPRGFVDAVAEGIERFYDQGVRFFEVHGEPNLTPAGLGSSWRTGAEFGEWFIDVIGLLRPSFPDAQFGWPGLSPGSSASGMRLDDRDFLASARSAVRQADWVGCHCYWEGEADLYSEAGGGNFRFYQSEWPDKLLLITEFSNPARWVDGLEKGRQYARYFEYLREETSVGAAFGFVISSAEHYADEVWRLEDGRLSDIARGVEGE
jgi:hypothetical protein